MSRPLHHPRHWVQVAALLACLAFSSLSLRAASPSAPAARTEVHEYTGTLGGGLRIGMGLTFGADGRSVEGAYFYNKYGRDIRLVGELTNRLVTLRELGADGTVAARFTGEFLARDPQGRYGTNQLAREVLVGTWQRSDGADKRPFEVSLDHIWFRRPGENHYANAGFDDDAAVEEFARRFRSAVLKRDVELVAGMISYPIAVDVRGVRHKFANAAALKRDYDTVFSAEYVKRIEACATTHLFSKSSGVMLGRGEVWIASVGERSSGKTPQVFVTRVISLNHP
jgi:hypothetical protein